MLDHAPSSQPGQKEEGVKASRIWWRARSRSRRRKRRKRRKMEEHTRSLVAGLATRPGGPQNSSLRAFAGKALTTVLAGFAFTMTILPKTSRFPALVAFFWRVLIITTPGMTNLPLFFVSVVAMLARVLKAVLITPFFTSQLSPC